MLIASSIDDIPNFNAVGNLLQIDPFGLAQVIATLVNPNMILFGVMKKHIFSAPTEIIAGIMSKMNLTAINTA
jgi:hypothetical protein